MKMDSFFTLVVIGAFSASYVNSQSTKMEWAASELYNPQTNAAMCGFPTNNTKAYICDPNGLLNTKDLIAVNWILADAAQTGTLCPCSTYSCESRKDATGYKIAVALVKRMKKDSVNGKAQSPQETARSFTRVLKTDKWAMGSCEENIIVFYSVEDKMLYIDPRKTAAVKLNPNVVSLLGKKVADRLIDGQLVEALNILIHDIKVLLNCDLENLYDCSIYEKGAAPIIKTSHISLLALMTTVLIYLFNH